MRRQHQHSRQFPFAQLIGIAYQTIGGSTEGQAEQSALPGAFHGHHLARPRLQIGQQRQAADLRLPPGAVLHMKQRHASRVPAVPNQLQVGCALFLRMAETIDDPRFQVERYPRFLQPHQRLPAPLAKGTVIARFSWLQRCGSHLQPPGPRRRPARPFVTPHAVGAVTLAPAARSSTSSE